MQGSGFRVLSRAELGLRVEGKALNSKSAVSESSIPRSQRLNPNFANPKKPKSSQPEP